MNTISELVSDIKAGRMVILIDDENRENEGDLVIAAEHITAEKINFLSRHACGFICLALEQEHLQKINLPLMVTENENQTLFKTAFTVSIDAAEGITTGISAMDRAHTILTASHPEAQPQQLTKPGHIMPLMAQPGGLLVRQGHTEASVDLCRLAGVWPAAVICEVLNEDGSVAKLPDLIAFSKKFSIKIGTIEDLVKEIKSK